MKIEVDISLRQARMVRDSLARTMRTLDTGNDTDNLLWDALDQLHRAMGKAMVEPVVPFEHIRCERCYNYFERPVKLRGRYPRFCSAACRQGHYRDKKR